MSYEITPQGSDFIYKFTYDLGSVGIEADRLIDWLYLIKDGEAEKANRILIGQVGKGRASMAVQWALRRGYIAEVEEEDFRDNF